MSRADDREHEERVRRRLERVLGSPVAERGSEPAALDQTPAVGLRGRLALVGLDPGRPGVRALAAVAIVVVAAAGLLAWRSRPHVEPVSPASAAVTAAAPVVPSPSSTVLVVAVSGRVRHPGLVRLPPGSRVADAIAAAGGVLPGTDLSQVNLARKVSDGELIVIGESGPAGGSAVGSDGGSGVGGGGGGGASGGPVNLNTASLAQLETLPGVGPVLAQRILDYRGQHGGFHSVSELRQVSGIGDSRYAQLKDLVMV
jgi:competence protein ComEA